MAASREPVEPPVTAVRHSSRGPSAPFALLGVIVVLAAAVGIALVSGPGPALSPSPAAVVSAPPSTPAPPGTPSPSPSATPVVPPSSTVLVFRSVADPAGALGDLTGCPLLRRTTGQPSSVVSGTAVDAVVADAGRDTGWLFVPPGIQGTTKVWLGDDVVELALAAGAHAVALGKDGAVWLGGPAGATRWQPIATPAGRTAWMMTTDEISGRGPCGPWTVPNTINHQRSLTCAGIGFPACLDDDLKVADWTTPGSDTVVVGDPCGSGCGDVAVWLPGGSAGADGIVGGATIRVGTPLRMPEPGLNLPDAVLSAVARPALPLPVGGEKAKGNACHETLIGKLGGAPWDPRVAWISWIPVVWPTGTVVRFAPSLELGYPGGVASALDGDSIRLTGWLDAKRSVFNACTVALAGRSSSAPTLSPAP